MTGSIPGEKRKRTLESYLQSKNFKQDGTSRVELEHFPIESAKELEQRVLKNLVQTRELSAETKNDKFAVKTQRLPGFIGHRGRGALRISSVLSHRQLCSGLSILPSVAQTNAALYTSICHRYRTLPVNFHSSSPTHATSLQFDPSGILLASLSSRQVDIYDFDEFDIKVSTLRNAREIVKRTPSGHERFNASQARYKETVQDIGGVTEHEEHLIDWDECESEEEEDDDYHWNRTGNWSNFARKNERIPSVAKYIKPVLSVQLHFQANVVRWNPSKSDFITVAGSHSNVIAGYDLNRNPARPAFQLGLPRASVLGFSSIVHVEGVLSHSKYMLCAGTSNGKIMLWDIRNKSIPVWQSKTGGGSKFQQGSPITTMLQVPQTSSILAGTKSGQLIEFDLRKMDIPLFGAKAAPVMYSHSVGFGGKNMGVAGMVLAPDRPDKMIFQLKSGHLGIYDRQQRKTKPVVRYRPTVGADVDLSSQVIQHYEPNVLAPSETLSVIPDTELVSVCFPGEDSVNLFSFSPFNKNFGKRLVNVTTPGKVAAVAVHPASRAVVTSHVGHTKLYVNGIAPKVES